MSEGRGRIGAVVVVRADCGEVGGGGASNEQPFRLRRCKKGGGEGWTFPGGVVAEPTTTPGYSRPGLRPEEVGDGGTGFSSATGSGAVPARAEKDASRGEHRIPQSAPGYQPPLPPDVPSFLGRGRVGWTHDLQSRSLAQDIGIGEEEGGEHRGRRAVLSGTSADAGRRREWKLCFARGASKHGTLRAMATAPGGDGERLLFRRFEVRGRVLWA